MKIETCDTPDVCHEMEVPLKLINMLDKCNHDGYLTDDDQSIVGIVNCLNEKSTHIVIVSEKVTCDQFQAFSVSFINFIPI